MRFISNIIQNRRLCLGLVALASLTALSAAFISELLLHLEPCILCIYQRYPFGLGLILGGSGLLISNKPKISAALLSACGLGFLVNTGIATYHTGVEQKWWASQVEGCSTPFIESTEGQSFFENLMSTPLGDCSKIPWQDPIIGLSMANYNIALCFGLFAMCILSLLFGRDNKQN